MLNTIPELYWLDFDLYDICMYVCRGEVACFINTYVGVLPVKLIFLKYIFLKLILNFFYFKLIFFVFSDYFNVSI
jgi:hypothetical protein